MTKNQISFNAIRPKEHEETALEIARGSITLLKNEGNLLPLEKDKASKILIVGPLANNMKDQTGGWTYHWQGLYSNEKLDYGKTIFEGIQAYVEAENDGEGLEIEYIAGMNTEGEWMSNQVKEDITEKAEKADYVIACIGEESYTEKFGDINDLLLPQGQRDLITLVANAQRKGNKKNVIVVLVQGRARLLGGIEDEDTVSSVINAYLPGPFGGQAFAEILFGDVNPSGRLPYTYPKFPQTLVNHLDQPSQLCIDEENIYVTCPVSFPFGAGLSYSSYEYSNIQLSKTTINEYEVQSDENIEISVDVFNDGPKAGKHAVILFMQQVTRIVVPERKKVISFDKIFLEAGETNTVSFNFKINELFSFIGVDDARIIQSSKMYFTFDYTVDCREDPSKCFEFDFTISCNDSTCEENNNYACCQYIDILD